MVIIYTTKTMISLGLTTRPQNTRCMRSHSTMTYACKMMSSTSGDDSLLNQLYTLKAQDVLKVVTPDHWKISKMLFAWVIPTPTPSMFVHYALLMSYICNKRR